MKKINKKVPCRIEFKPHIETVNKGKYE